MMRRKIKIQPVAARNREHAIRFVAAGSRQDAAALARAAALRTAADKAGTGGTAIWWARRRGRCVAAAMVIDRPGRTGMLFRSPTDAPGVEARALADVERAVTEEALGRGMVLVQAFVPADAQGDREVLEAAGFEFLVQLVYMRLSLSDRPAAQPTGPRLRARRYGEYEESELAELIAATYEGSLDCPPLCGVRRMEDVLAAHKDSGVFRPQSWWVFDCDGRTAGCALVNGGRGASSAVELVYLGVRPSFRGRGLGRRMLAHAVGEASGSGAAAMKLAVDARNTYAMGMYEAAGFREVDRVTVMARLKPASGEAAP